MDPRPFCRLSLATRVLRVLVLIVLLVGLLASCAEKQAVDPKPVLTGSVQAMRELKSFHFAYEVIRPQGAKPSTGTEISRIVGDVAAQGKMRATIDLLQRGVPLQINFIALGDTHYVQDPTSRKWQAVPAIFSPVGRLNLNAGTIQILERFTNPVYVGTDEKEGTSTYHIKGSVAAQDVAAIAGATTTTTPFEADVWIGVKDHLVHLIQVVGAASKSEDPKTRRTIELSRFNSPVTIEAPL